MRGPSFYGVGQGLQHRRLRAAKRTDKTVQVKVRALAPGKRYYFRFVRGRARSDRDTFKTAPRTSSRRPVTFAWTGDADPVVKPGTNRLLNAPFAVFARMRREGNDFNSGILEVTTGPSGTDTFKSDLNDESGNPQAGDLVNAAFFTRPPPDGPGIRCSQLDTFSYGQVTVTGKRLSIALKDLNGGTVKGADGKSCGPYVVPRR